MTGMRKRGSEGTARPSSHLLRGQSRFKIRFCEMPDPSCNQPPAHKHTKFANTQGLGVRDLGLSLDFAS